jgi:hypothetical protein
MKNPQHTLHKLKNTYKPINNLEETSLYHPAGAISALSQTPRYRSPRAIYRSNASRYGHSGVISGLNISWPVVVSFLRLQSAIGSTGFERIGFEHCGPEASKCNWLERARADWLRAQMGPKMLPAVVRTGYETSAERSAANTQLSSPLR